MSLELVKNSENAPTVLAIGLSAAMTFGVIARRVVKFLIDRALKQDALDAERLDAAVKRAVEANGRVESLLSARVTELTGLVTSLTTRLAESENRRYELERMVESVKAQLVQMRENCNNCTAKIQRSA